MFKKFYPYCYMDSTYSINFNSLYNEGYRGLLFDIDNTLVEHGKAANQKVLDLFKLLKEIGFKVCLISNNKEERVISFNKDINVNYIFKANKPSSKNYIRAMELMKTDVTNTIFVGDQVFTDIYGANRVGIRTYLVKPINKKEEIQIVLKRYLEKIVLFFYIRYERKKNNEVAGD